MTTTKISKKEAKMARSKDYAVGMTTLGKITRRTLKEHDLMELS